MQDYYKHVQPPTFDNVEEERQYRKTKLAGAYRVFAQYGFNYGVAGHITVRDPEYPDRFWVNSMTMSFGKIKASNLMLVNHEGEILEGEGILNRAGFAIHSEIHKARPDAVAVAHSHSLYGKTWSTMGRLLEPITQNACVFYNDHVLYNQYNGLVNELSEGEQIAMLLGNKKAAILQNHGLLTVGASVDSAVWWYITMERCCQVQLMAEATGQKPIPIDEKTALETYNMIGSEHGGWYAFQPVWDQIITDHPEIAD